MKLENGRAEPVKDIPRQSAAIYRIETGLKKEFSDPEGAAALARLRAAGISAAKDVRVCRIYAVRGPFSLSHIQIAAREIFSDGVTQEHRVNATQPLESKGAGRWRVEVWPDPETQDSLEDGVARAFSALNLPRPLSVRRGAVYRIEARAARPHIESAARLWLCGPLERISIWEGA
ncbi:MAG: hypothetical protein ACYCPQ_02300 [Elusimicrobiota bacterium]